MMCEKLLGKAFEIKSIIKKMPQIAESNSSVLIHGETGVGKELIADIIHAMSKRKKKPFVKVSLSEISPTLFESELFGHKKGAFTDAVADKKGLFDAAQHGTIFLDEIDDFPLELQSKILRVLEAKTKRRVGEENSTTVDVRIIAATKNNLRLLIAENKFREDLFHRLNTIPIVIPPLRERQEDIPLLVNHFLQMFSPDNGLRFSDDAMNALLNYRWPGNVRELMHVIERLSVLNEGEIKREDLPDEIKNYDLKKDIVKSCTQCFNDDDLKLDDVMKCVEKNIIQSVMKTTNGSLTKSAQKLGIPLSTLHDKMKKHDTSDLEK